MALLKNMAEGSLLPDSILLTTARTLPMRPARSV